MEKSMKIIALLAVLVISIPAYALDQTAVRELSAVLNQGPKSRHWQVRADELYRWIKEKKKDFIVVDVRPTAKEYKNGHVPGAIYIPYNEILKPRNLRRLPRNKKIILYCVTGQTQNLPVVVLRALGYDARVMSFGFASWGKGYWGGKMMLKAIGNASKKNFPIER